MRLLLFAALSAGQMLAQETTIRQACPVEIQQAVTYDRGPCHPTLYCDEVSVQFKNKSEKAVAGVKFQLMYINKFGEVSDPTMIYADHKLEVNEARRSFFRNPLYPRQGVSVSVEKVAFVDGEIWTDDGSHSCSWKTPKENILDR